jgi:hypothetical protein
MRQTGCPIQMGNGAKQKAGRSAVKEEEEETRTFQPWNDG